MIALLLLVSMSAGAEECDLYSEEAATETTMTFIQEQPVSDALENLSAEEPARAEDKSPETELSPVEGNEQEDPADVLTAAEDNPEAEALAGNEMLAPENAPAPEELPPQGISEAAQEEQAASDASENVFAEESAGAEDESPKTELSPVEENEQEPEPADVLTAAEDKADVLPMSDYSDENSVRGFVYRLYSTVFQREPDQNGLNFWVHQLETGSDTAAGAVSFFFNSKEYQSSGKTNGEVVNDCYHTMMNRAPEEGGYQYWKQRLDVGMTPQVVLSGFVYSDEFGKIISKYGVARGDIRLTNARDKNYERTYFIYRLFNNCLGREADPAGEEYWCERLDNGTTGVEVANGFFFSNEFVKNRYNNSTFVQLLYKAIQGREYDSSGLIHWTNRLNLYDTREKVLNGFALSPEFQEQCRLAQISAGDPLETPDDGFEWQYNIQVLRLCNIERRKAGLGDLYTREDLLWDVAITRASETTEFFSHTRPDGSSCFDLFTEQGFYGNLGENIAAGTPYNIPEKVVEAWMNSAGHRANILSPNYTYLATGYIYDPYARSYCEDGKYKGQYVQFKHYSAQSFCDYGIKIE